jgi:hypothetical protein
MGIFIVDEIKKEQAKGFDYRHAENLVVLLFSDVH